MQQRKRRMTLEEGERERERGMLDQRHSPHNEAVNVVIPIHVAELEVPEEAKQISGMRK